MAAQAAAAAAAAAALAALRPPPAAVAAAAKAAQHGQRQLFLKGIPAHATSLDVVHAFAAQRCNVREQDVIIHPEATSGAYPRTMAYVTLDEAAAKTAMRYTTRVVVLGRNAVLSSS